MVEKLLLFFQILLAIFSSVFSVIMSTLASFLLFRFRWYQFPFSFLVLIYTLSTTLWQCTRCLVVCVYRGKMIVTNEFRAKNWKVKSLEHFCEKLYACQLALKHTLPFFVEKRFFNFFSVSGAWKCEKRHLTIKISYLQLCLFFPLSLSCSFRSNKKQNYQDYEAQ
jgi:hypothetical protein